MRGIVSEWRIGMKKYLNRIFIDGLSGMALGLFSTLIIGTILVQIGNFVPGILGTRIIFVGTMAKFITGAGIGIGVASKLKEAPLVAVSAAVAGMIGAFPSLSAVGSEFAISGAGEPLGAFVAAIVAIEIGRLVSGRTKLDIILTPFVSISAGAIAGIFVGPYITKFTTALGEIVNINVEKSPILGGIIVAAVMGIILTLPISSAAIGVSLGLSGLAAGAAVVGCCCQMVGFAVASYRENKAGGLLAQGLGTSMLQIPNIVRRPIIWLPHIISSIILGPLSSAVLKMTSSPIGSGMGSAGLVGQFETYFTMVNAGVSIPLVMIEIMVMHFILPAVLTLSISEGMRKAGWIRNGDMALKVD